MPNRGTRAASTTRAPATVQSSEQGGNATSKRREYQWTAKTSIHARRPYMFFFLFIFVGFGCVGIEAWAEGAPIEALDGAALAGTAMVRAVPPMAASPTTKAVAVLAMRVLIIGVS